MRVLFIEWSDPVSKSWVTVGKLVALTGKFTFQYTKGVEKLERFTPFEMMNDLYLTYEASELFPLFANRLLNKSRPEYKSFLRWLKFGEDVNPLDVLALTQGLRGTDSLRVFSLPKHVKGIYKTSFFARGVSHVATETVVRIDNLKRGDSLYLMDDVQNEFDDALALRTGEPKAMVGYLPSYLSPHLKALLHDKPDIIQVSVSQLNEDAPLPYRLLCELRLDARGMSGLFECEDYEVIE